MNNILIDFGTLLYNLNDIKSNSKYFKKIKSSLAIYNFTKKYFNKRQMNLEYTPEDIVNIASFIMTSKDVNLIDIDESIMSINTSASENVGTIYGYIHCIFNGQKIDINATFNELSNNSISIRNNIKVTIQAQKEDDSNSDVTITLEYSELSPHACFTDRRKYVYKCAILAIDFVLKTTIHGITKSLTERYVK